MRDAAAKNRLAAQKKASCPQGHAYTTTNTYMDSAGYRYCRTCRHLRESSRWQQRDLAKKREYNRNYYRKRPAAVA